MNKIKNLLCRHHGCNQVICWRWTYGFNYNKPVFIEVQLRCLKCDRLYFRRIRNIEECNIFAECYPDKQWSEECQPILNIKYKENPDENKF